jgi:hypothetical protein
MSAAATSAEPASPSRAERLLCLVRKLIDFGRELAATLHHRAATDPRSVVRAFGICDLALILLRIQRGLLRASALEARLVQNAVRLDAETKPRSAPAARKPRSAPAARKPRPARPAARRAEAPDARPELPTEAEIAAWVRHRPIGAVIADICRDLGIACDHPLWRELQLAITRERGNYVRLVSEIIDRGARRIAEAWFPSPPPPIAPAATGPP